MRFEAGCNLLLRGVLMLGSNLWCQTTKLTIQHKSLISSPERMFRRYFCGWTSNIGCDTMSLPQGTITIFFYQISLWGNCKGFVYLCGKHLVRSCQRINMSPFGCSHNWLMITSCVCVYVWVFAMLLSVGGARWDHSPSQVFNMPPHVLPAMQSFCPSFLSTLHPPTRWAAIDDEDLLRHEN